MKNAFIFHINNNAHIDDRKHINDIESNTGNKFQNID